MERVVVVYDLKEGATEEQYVEFSRELDQVVTARCPGVLHFEVHLVNDAWAGVQERETPHAPFSVIETIDVASWDAWKRVVASDEMGPVREGFADVADLDTVVMLRCAQV